MAEICPAGPTGPKEKKSLRRRLFPPRPRGAVSLMGRVLRTLTTLSRLTSEPAPCTPPPATPDPPSPRPTPEHGSPRIPDSPRTPGLSGLKNHGNTCFMNAVLQCLSNTELFAEYLALEQYRGPGGADSGDTQMDGLGCPEETDPMEQYRGNPVGRGAEVTEQLASLLRSLWTLEYTPQHSREFKTVVSKNALQYRGNSQHDAQEFLLWLLDRVHEDLNSVTKHNGGPPIKPPLEEEPPPDGPPFSVAGTFVQELFQAQYRSSLTCPHCQKQSNTFDPFLCISLPIPLPHTRPLYVTVVYQGKCSHCMRIGVAVPLSGTVARLREAVSMETKIPPDQIVLTEMYFDGFHRSFSDTDDLDAIHESDSIFAFETLEIFRPEGILTTQEYYRSCYMQGSGKASRVDLVSKRSSVGEKIVLLVCNRACTGQQGKRFGQPFVLHLERTIPWDILQKEILEKLQYFLRPTACIQVCPFSLRVVSFVGITYLLPQEEHPLCHPTVERALKSCGLGGTPHVKIVVEWDRETKEYLFGNTEEEYVPDSESVRVQREIHHQPQTCTLSQCFQLYTKEEQLAPDDAWRCPHCKQLQQGSIRLSLWTLPDVLIIHLKRFRQDGDRRMKLQNMVKFPLLGLDMTPHVVKRSQSSWSLPSHWSPWRRPYGLGRDPEDFIYDLYAVCNHQGTMQAGHYIAYCKNSVDGLWYCFDDSEVRQLSEEEVCKHTAYILFYQRRAAVPSWSANSSVAGSTSSSLCEHWVSRLPGSKQPSIASAASSRRTSLASLSESVELAGERSEDDGGFSTRPFVRSVQRQSLSCRSSVTSPLAANENCFRPSWSLSAKLHMRSSSPSPIHTAASTLAKIGETVVDDDKVSTSCFGSLRNLSSSYLDHSDSNRRDAKGPARAPLAVMEPVLRDDTTGKKQSPALLDPQSKCSGQHGRKSPKIDPFDNNNQIAFVDQSDSVETSPVKDSKPHSAASLVGQKGDAASTNPPAVLKEQHQDKGLKKVRTLGTDGGAPASQPSTTVLPKKSQKISISRSKNESSKGITRRSSATSATVSGTPKKGSCKAQEAVAPAVQSKQKPCPATSSPSVSLKKTASAAPPVRGCSGLPSSSTIKNKTNEKTLSRESSKVSLGPEKPAAPGTPKVSSSPQTPQPKAIDGKLANTQLRSLSMASLRSSTTNVKPALKRDSKSEDKGLSFFKSALRQKETRRSTDLGKTTMLSKKTAGGSKSDSKSSVDEKSEKSKSTSCSEQSSINHATKERLSVKTLTPTKHSILGSQKSKSSPSDSAQPVANGKRNFTKPLKKAPSSIHSSVQSASKTQ
ncbi:ubiquitin carboxyl-terminal hydrolase 31 isoform X2 [Ambystoma mexicanum]|uniref:ubiquitin carboxyl-terminal hydrolase 31 isoform X2 n=1 Tax=Ambystoma mexicanum TaxID=8296 RepID=UPI0037E9AF48